MSNKTDFQTCLTAIQAIPVEQVKEPNMPVDNFVQEADNLYLWLQPDLAVLAAKGITQLKIDELPVRAGALREAQSLWIRESRSQDVWNKQSPAAYELRDDLIADFRYAFRNEPSLLARVDEIDTGDGHEDMIQDLNDLSVLGDAHTELLSAIGIDLSKLEIAANLSDVMGQLLAEVNETRTGGNDAKYLRDQAYTHLKQLVDEIRECGKYAFRKDEKRVQGYYSSYWRKKNSTKADSTETTELPVN